MKCLSCDCILTDRESSRKGIFSGEYLDLCDDCLITIPDLEYEENPALSNKRPTEVVEEQEETDGS